MLRICGLAVRYGPIAAVKGVDLDVARGEIVALIGELREGGLTVLLVEQKARHTLKIADRAYLLETGRVVFSGAAQDLAGNRLVTDSFLGGHVRGRDGRTSTEARGPS